LKNFSMPEPWLQESAATRLKIARFSVASDRPRSSLRPAFPLFSGGRLGTCRVFAHAAEGEAAIWFCTGGYKRDRNRCSRVRDPYRATEPCAASRGICLGAIRPRADATKVRSGEIKVRKGEIEVRTVEICVRTIEACVRKDENRVGKIENEACRDDPRTSSDGGLASV
jgi:hypothetical protein